MWEGVGRWSLVVRQRIERLIAKDEIIEESLDVSRLSLDNKTV